MTEGTIQEKYNHFTLIIDIDGTKSYVKLSDVLDYNGEALSLEDIRIGDLVIFQNQKYYVQKPKLYPLDIIEAHPYYSSFKKDYILDFTHFRKIQSGERCQDLRIGISLIELISIKKSREMIEKLRNLGEADSFIVKIADFLNKNIEAGTQVDKILNQIESKLFTVENFATELRLSLGEDGTFTQLGVCLCRFNSCLEYIGGNNHYFENRVDFLCSNLHDSWILYKKDYFFNLPSPNLQFFLKIDPRPSKDLMKKMIDEKTEDIEKLILKSTLKAISKGIFETLRPITDPYFHKHESANAINYKNAVNQIKCSCCEEIIKNDEVKLPCGHKFRNICFVKRVLGLTEGKVVLTEEEKTRSQPLACICGLVINESALKAHIKDYSKYVEKAVERVSFICQKCGLKAKQQDFILNCKHYCTLCQIEIMRLGYLETCMKCEKNITDKEMEALKKVKTKCEDCSNTFFSLQAFPYLICDHSTCFDCAKRRLKSDQWQCFKGCKVKLNENHAYWYLKGKCLNCPKEFYKYEEIYMHKNCNCAICPDCVTNSERLKCENCGTGYSGFIEYLINESKQTKLKRLRDCPVCGTQKDLDDILVLQNCSHFICSECMKGTAKAAYESSNIIQIFQCFDCKAPISEDQLEYFFSIHNNNLLDSTDENNYWDKVNILKIKKDIKLSKCPRCPAEFITGNNRYANCFSCGYEYCTKCFEDYHPPDNSCQLIFINRRIQEMEKMFPGEPISQCPLCHSPYMKDEQCNHVKCTDCNIDFCFVCSSIRSPILVHGNHYHRPQCTDYGALPKNEVDKFSDKCTECVKNKKLCPRPVDLAVRGRYGNGETGY